MAENESLKSSFTYETFDPKVSSIVDITSKQELRDVLDLRSLTQVIDNSLEEKVPESAGSTEEIYCNDDACFVFKSIHNPGLRKAYHNKRGQPDTRESGKEAYLRMVKEAKLAPVKRIVNSLDGPSLKLQYYGLDSRQMKPLTEVLMTNTTVQELNLTCNPLNVDALYHLGQMLRKNRSIRKLNLQHCRIGPEGAVMLGQGLEICENLNDLDLSYNELGDDGMEVLAVKLGYNASIKKLNLSHNSLTHQSGFSLADTMEENLSIQHLDLSWNQISEEQGLKKFLYTAAELNESLLKVDLSWNALGGDKIANIIKNFIGQHRSLQELNLSHNRFATTSENIKIARGINASESLQVLDLSYNGLTATTAFSLLSTLTSKTKLRSLRLDNVWVKPEFDKLRQDLKPQLEVVVDGVSGGVDFKRPDMQTLLLKRAHYLGYKPQKNKKDFGWFLLRLQKSGNLVPVKKVTFEKLVQEDKIKFDNGMIDEFAKKFRDENKKIDLNLMLQKYLALYPNTVLLEKEKKKIKQPKDQENSPADVEDLRNSKDQHRNSLRSLKKNSDTELKALGRKSSTGLQFDAISKKESMLDKVRESFKIEPLIPDETKTSNRGSMSSRHDEMFETNKDNQRLTSTEDAN